MTTARTLLGFDYGKKRIGIAVGQELTGTASPLATVTSVGMDPDWTAISRHVDTWHPDALVVGLPLHMDGTEHDLTAAARRFGEQLRQRFQLPVYWIDERLSSLEAEQILAAGPKAAGRSPQRRKTDIDKVAAQLILQTWLAQARQP